MRSGDPACGTGTVAEIVRVELASSRTATVSERSIRDVVAAGVKRNVRPLDSARTVIERARRGSTIAGTNPDCASSTLSCP